MIYKNKPSYFVFLYVLILGGPLFYIGGVFLKTICVMIFLYGVYNYTEDQIHEQGISKRRVFLFYEEFISFEKLEKVICPCIPELTTSATVSNRLLFYSGNKSLQFRGVFTDSKEDIVNIKRVLHFIESKGVKVYLLVPSGEEKKQMFTGFEVIKRLPDKPVIWF